MEKPIHAIIVVIALLVFVGFATAINAIDRFLLPNARITKAP